MSRRRGQNGNFEQHGNSWFIRFWIDAPGQEKRRHACVKVCPVHGPGSLNKPERLRRAREIIQESGADTEQLYWAAKAANLGTTFREQARAWLEHVQNRKRRPVKPATLIGWQSYLNKRLLPDLGDMPLAAVNNQAARTLVAKMAEDGLSPKTIVNHVQVVKMVVASAIRDTGEPMFPVVWNHEFIDLPIVRKQQQPAFNGETVSSILERSRGWHRVLFALLAGTGLRIGEALGLEIQHLGSGFRTLRVRQSNWRGKIQEPKSTNALREIDMAPALSAMLREFIGDRHEGYLFEGRNHLPIASQSDILRQVLHPILKKLNQPLAGFHAFRRFRITHLRKCKVPEGLIQYWAGHAPRTVTDRYSKLEDEPEFRQQCAATTGLGFQIPPGDCRENGSEIDVLSEPVRKEAENTNAVSA